MEMDQWVAEHDERCDVLEEKARMVFGLTMNRLRIFGIKGTLKRDKTRPLHTIWRMRFTLPPKRKAPRHSLELQLSNTQLTRDCSYRHTFLSEEVLKQFMEEGEFRDAQKNPSRPKRASDFNPDF